MQLPSTQVFITFLLLSLNAYYVAVCGTEFEDGANSGRNM
jgi:hypothetical protein